MAQEGDGESATAVRRLEDLSPTELLGGLFRLLFGREADVSPDGAFVTQLEDGSLSPRQLVEWLVHADEWTSLAPMTQLGPALHYSRGTFIRLLPPARRILDLGGSARTEPKGAMVLMGYPYDFEELVIVDLPGDERNALYRDGAVRDRVETPRGPVTYRYHSMADLSAFDDHSFDLVYAGQSIEHVVRPQAGQVFDQVRRVLRPGGVFALDTPNAVVTRLQQASFIDPDHKYEYTDAEMRAELAGHGFEVTMALGLNYAGSSIDRGSFSEVEVATRRGLYAQPERCYILAYLCRPRPGPARRVIRALRALR